jgi:pyruvate kinase
MNNLTNKKTKIVATIGPASHSPEVLKEMILAGMNVARINFSHGDHETHLEVVKSIRSLNEELGTHIAILGDLQGPKLRVGDVPEIGIELVDGANITFTTEQVTGNKERVQIRYATFAEDVKPGEKVLVDDGKLQLEVVSTNGKDEVVLKVIHGGILYAKKGVNLPNTKISQPSLTEKDVKDLKFAIDHQFDWIALSFVRAAKDIVDLKKRITDQNGRSSVIAKIEKPEALEEIEDITRESDGLMVARGDLGVEIPMQKVPLVQKMLIRTCLKYSKPVIVATQMMESMITNFNPTRAEVNDVANAVLDGTDAVMLSGETSVGQFPVGVIKNMTSIIEHMEDGGDIYFNDMTLINIHSERMISDSICHSATHIVQRTGAKGIVTMTHSGYTANKISSYRPNAAVFVFTKNRSLLTKMSLVWGVEGFYYDKMVSTDHTIADIKYILKKQGELKEGDLLVNLASMPISEQGMSNMLKLSRIE